MRDNYLIRSDYAARPAAQTLVGNAQDYWNAARIEASGHYQYHVYSTLAAAIRRRTFPTLSVHQVSGWMLRSRQSCRQPNSSSNDAARVTNPSNCAGVGRSRLIRRRMKFRYAVNTCNCNRR